MHVARGAAATAARATRPSSRCSRPAAPRARPGSAQGESGSAVPGRRDRVSIIPRRLTCPRRSTHHPDDPLDEAPRGGSSGSATAAGSAASPPGSAATCDVNPLVYRIAFAALALAGGTGVLLYLAAWLVMPGEDRTSRSRSRRCASTASAPGSCSVSACSASDAVLTLTEADFWPGNGNLWLARDPRRRRARLVQTSPHGDERPRRPSARGVGETRCGEGRPLRRLRGESRAVPLPPPVFGALLAAAGFFGLLAVLDVYDVDVSGRARRGRRRRRRGDRRRRADRTPRRRA